MSTNKRDVRRYLKDFLLQVNFSNIEVRYKHDGIVFLRQGNKEVGYIGVAFVSNKFSDFGSQFGLFVSCRFGEEMYDCIVAEVVKQLNLSYKPMPMLPNSSFGFTSLNYLSDNFFNGVASFYEHENLMEKCKEISDRIQILYLPKAVNFVRCNDDLIEDIIRDPQNYAYPMAYIMTTCYLNSKHDDIESILAGLKKRHIYDNTQSKIKEIRSKLDKYFDCSSSLRLEKHI